MLHAVKSTSTYTPKKMGTSTLNIIFLSLLKRSFFFFSLKVESKATCLILHFFFSHDRSDCQQNSSVSVLQKAKQKLEEMGIDAYTII